MAYEVIKPLDQDIITMKMDGHEDQVFTVKQLKESTPGWTGEYSLGDIVDVEGDKLRIIGIDTRFPDGDDTVTKYTLTIGKYPA